MCRLTRKTFLIPCAPRSPATGVRPWSNVTKTSRIRHVKGPAGEGWPHCDHSPSSLICCHYLYEHFKIKNNQRGRTAMWQSGLQRESERERTSEETFWTPSASLWLSLSRLVMNNTLFPTQHALLSCRSCRLHTDPNPVFLVSLNFRFLRCLRANCLSCARNKPRLLAIDRSP